MEQFQLLREKAKNKLVIADHMLTMTYPLVKDTKLLLVIMENLFLALTYAMSSVLYYEKLFKRIPPFTDNFESKFNIFKERCVNKYEIDRGYLTLLQNIKNLMVDHKKSPIEFERKGKFVICSDSYRLRTITTNQIKEYNSKTKEFIHLSTHIVSKNEEIFR